MVFCHAKEILDAVLYEIEKGRFLGKLLQSVLILSITMVTIIL
jgi:hypothetical protein